MNNDGIWAWSKKSYISLRTKLEDDHPNSKIPMLLLYEMLKSKIKYSLYVSFSQKN